ncbi:coiled-coil domain-containing protein 86 [Atheta coriaria]|uniref:coiled-coil domain-containing protein 86 n=1 Tax=Dalotia coriaria TaxID=877792 RepID=UPI0031F33C7F
MTTKEVKLDTQKTIIKGRPKSGRVWKSDRKRFSSIVKTKGIRNSFEKKEALRKQLKLAKDASRAIKEEKAQEKEAKKERRRENLRRQEENLKRSEIVQVIKNTSKIKKMKKKHLRQIEKRDTNDM